jgi:tetratricopeptide (TPR) repeat protein
MKCPHCASSDTVWKAKAGKWECNSCEERFEGDSPENHASVSGGHPMPSAKAAKHKRIFFSYGHDANRDLVDRFKADLEARGHQVWIDYKEIGTWDDWKGTITRGIHDAELAIAFLSIHSTRDPGVCRNEVAMALQHFGKVYPVLVEQVPQESIPVTIAHLQWPDLSRWRDFRDQEDLDFERFYEEKFLEIVSRVEGEAGRFASEAEVLRRALNPSGFEGRFARHLDGFTGREWVFDAFEHWLDHQSSSRVFWIKAGPGFGKTALAVQMANRHRAAIVGTWFCDHQSVELRDPLRALQTIAYQLALRWDDYRVRLLPRLGLYADSSPEQIEEARKELAKKSLQDLFSFLISEPIAGLIWREHKLVILVDALDEATEADGTNPLAALISGRFLELPEWIGFVVTSRPDASVVPYLQGFKPFAIEAGDDRNTADLQSYSSAHIGPMLLASERERLCNLLVEKSEGMMLYLRLVSEGLHEGTLAVENLVSLEAGLPGLHGRYHAGFEARFGKDFHDAVQPLLRLIMAAPGPMPLDLAAEVLEWDRELAVRTRARVGSYLVEDQGGLSLFHKTLGEWLGSESAALYFTDAYPAAKKLGTFLWERFEAREEDRFGRTQPLRWEAVVIDWLPKLLNSTERGNDLDSIDELADWFRCRGLFNSSQALYRRALEVSEKALGTDHPKTLARLDDLGDFLSEKGDYEGAGVVYHRVLETMKMISGPEDPDTWRSLDKYAKLLEKKGDYGGAEALARRALTIAEDHEHVLGSLNRLARLLQRKGDNETAEALLRRIAETGGVSPNVDPSKPTHRSIMAAVGSSFQKTRSSLHLVELLAGRGDCKELDALYRQALEVEGPKDAKTLLILDRLADCLGESGDWDGAEALYRRDLETFESANGPEHPDTLDSLRRLARFLTKKGEHECAEALYRRALEVSEKALGVAHPETLASLDNLADFLSKKGDYKSAEVLYRRALGLSTDNKEVFIASLRLDRLAGCLGEIGDWDGAEALYRQDLAAMNSPHGPEGSDTFHSLRKLTDFLKKRGDSEGIDAPYRRALEANERILGLEHPITFRLHVDLGDFLSKKGDYAGALLCYRQVLERIEKASGVGHPDTLESLSRLAGVLEKLGDFKGAESLYQRVLATSEKTLGPEHSDTLASLEKFAEFLEKQGDSSGAETLYRRMLETLEKARGGESPYTLRIIGRLGLLLGENGQENGAEELCRRAFKGFEKIQGVLHPDTLISVNNLGFVLNSLGRRAEALELLRRFANLSGEAREFVAYNLACYECLEGNHDEAKQLIAVHLEMHPNEKDQALADPDLTAIHEWISQL